MKLPTLFASIIVSLALVLGDTVGASAQAVQLPTFHFFTTNTTVVVPDGGDVLIGGVGRSSAGRIQCGIPGLGARPFTNSATGRSTGAGMVSASAQIHDLQAMDEALLASDSPAAVAGSSRQSFRIPFAAEQSLVLNRSSDAIASIADIRAQAAKEETAKQAEIANDLRRGRDLLAEGKTGIAKIYITNAARHATGELRAEAIAELQRLEQPKVPPRFAGRP